MGWGTRFHLVRAAKQSFERTLREAHGKAPEESEWYFENLARPSLSTPEIEAALKYADVEPEELITSLRNDHAKILLSDGFTLHHALQLRLWLRHLGEASLEEIERRRVGDSNDTISDLLFIALVAAIVLPFFILVPLAILPPLGLSVFVFFLNVLFFLVVLSFILLFYEGLKSHRLLGPDPESSENLRENVVLPLLRSYINIRLRERGYDEYFPVTVAPALSDLDDRGHLVATGSVQKIARAAAAMRSGSIGIAGPRGVGKSTLLKSFCENSFAHSGRPDLRILIPAPVHYNARDFAVHAFGRLCEEVIAVYGASSRPRFGSYRRVIITIFRLSGPLILLSGFLLYQFSVGSLINRFMIERWVDVAAYFVPGLLLAFLSVNYAGRILDSILIRSGRVDPETRDPTFGLVMSLLPALVVLSVQIPRWESDGESFSFRDVLSVENLAIALMVLGVVLFFESALMVERFRLKKNDPTNIKETARSNLRKIRFTETVTTGFTGSVQIVKPAQVSGTKSQALAQQELSFPQVVAHYREFATQVARWWSDKHEGQGRLVIGIDELDKMGAEDAEKFVNEVKGLFGTPNCLNLVSVSTDALAQFETRSLSIRTSFDTAFDDIIRVEHLNYQDVCDLLTRRVAGIPDTLIALCYGLSGGLPRDCLRVARRLVQLNAESQENDPSLELRMSDFVERIVREEVVALKNELVLREMSPALVLAISDRFAMQAHRLLAQDWPETTSGDLALLAEVLAEEEGLEGLAAQFRFLSAVLVLFVDHGKDFSSHLRLDASSVVPHVSTLAQARAAGPQSTSMQTLLLDKFLTEWAEWVEWNAGNPVPHRPAD